MSEYSQEENSQYLKSGHSERQEPKVQLWKVYLPYLKKHKQRHQSPKKRTSLHNLLGQGTTKKSPIFKTFLKKLATKKI